MGAKKKVDAKLYAKVKKELKSPKDDKKVMKKYNLGQTTVRAIRNSKSYAEFNKKTRTDRKKFVVKRDFKVNPIVREPATSQERAFGAWIGFVTLALAAGIIVVWLICRWLAKLIFGV